MSYPTNLGHHNKYQKLSQKKNYKNSNLKPGDCIFHHCEIIHGSNANHSSSNRIGLVMSLKING